MSVDPRDPVALAQALIRCPSVTPAEGGAIALLEALLAAAGFETRRLPFADRDTPDIDNLYARIGPRDRPAFMFAGHTDVVPPGDDARWTLPPFAGTVSGGELYGRGAVDMKGAVAASVAAALRHLDRAPGAPIAFLITGDEEGPAINGTVKMLDWLRARGDATGVCLLGEPTNPAALGDAVKIGRRGSLSGTVTIEGVQGHVAYPHLARNPVRDALPLLATLTAAPLDAGTTHFDASNLEIVGIETDSGAFNVIPGRLSARFNIRFNDLWRRDNLEAELRRRLDGTGLPYVLAFERTHSEAFLTAPGPFVDAVVAAVEGETGRRPALSTSGGTSDARFIKDYCPVVEFGLVGRTMHQVDERVPLADLEALTRIYERILARHFTG